MQKHSGRQYNKSARLLYRVYSASLAALSRVKPLFTLALRILTHREQQVKGHILPVNVNVGKPEQSPLARDVLLRLIGSAAAIGAMNECMCRRIGACADYPADLGCLVLGGAAKSLHPGLGRAVSREEAAAIVDRAISSGLTPMVIRMKSEGMLWSLDHRRMLTVCFCCPCHCLIRKAMEGRETPRVTGLPGVAVALEGEKCLRCGRCEQVCFTGALQMREGRAHIERDKCVACGRCAMACKTGALSVEMHSGFDADAVIGEYESRTDGRSV